MSRDISSSLTHLLDVNASRPTPRACKPHATRVSAIPTRNGKTSSPYAVVLAFLLATLALTGCGSGGYAGSGITSLSSSAITIDAGQAFQVTAALSANEPVSWSLAGGNACSGAACGSLSAATGTTTTYTAPAGITSQLKLTLTAALSGTNNSKIVSITVNPDPVISGTLPAGTVGTPYTGTLKATGGTAPLKFTTVGALPAGLTFDGNTGIVSGTPTTAGTVNFSAQIVDSSDVPNTVTKTESIAVSTAVATLTFIAGNPPAGTVGSPYTTTLGASGGTAPYTFTITSGSLPPGLTLTADTGVIAGTPTAVGNNSFTAEVTDASGTTASAGFSIVVNAAGQSLSLSTLPGGTVGVPYNATITVTGGTAPYTCSLASGTLPAGLALSTACVVSGTPSAAGTASFNVEATDASSPAMTVNGPETITIGAQGTIVLSSPPSATVGVPYTGTIGVTGGTAPYMCSLVAGPLPAGLTLGANCVITGTATTPGSFPITVKGTDSGSPVLTGTEIVTVTVLPANLTLTLPTLPNATVGVPYSATIGVSGGVPPYTCTLAGGSLPAGLSLAPSCLVSGTPTTAGGPVTFQVTANDSNSPAATVTGPESITVVASATLILSNPPSATVNVPYTGTIGVAGGTSPYTCQLITGPLPTGLTLGANCVVTGTPTQVGSFPIVVKGTDASTPTAKTGQQAVTITVANTPLTISSTLPNATVGTPYTATIGVTGGTSPYTCSLMAGTLPAGLSLSAACVVSGTPTVADSVILSVKATDTGNPAETGTGPVALTVTAAAPTLTLSNPATGTVNAPYSGSIGVNGGKAPYVCTITAGSLPAGLTQAAPGSCALTGTPTTATTPTDTFTVKATDASNPQGTVTGPVVMTIVSASTSLSLSNPPPATVSVPYTGSIGVTGGTSPYVCQITAGTLPTGLTLTPGSCGITGTPTTAVPPTVVVTVKVTDSATPTAGTFTGPVTVTVNPVPTLTLTGSLPKGILGVPYSQTLVATGGVQPYSYAVTAGTLPAGLTMSTGGTISGTPTAVGASSFTVTVTDTESTPQKASLPLVLQIVYPTTPNDPELNGPYAFLFQGYDDVVLGVLAYQTSTVASFNADGQGGISLGEQDANHQSSNPSGNTVSSHPFLGSYTLGTDSRGMMTLTVLNADGTTGATTTYAIALKAPVAPATVATKGSLIEYDGANLTGTRGSGTLLAQDAASFGAGLNGSYAFGLSGDTPCVPTCTLGIGAGPVAAVGEFTTDGVSAITTGTGDANIASTHYAQAPLTGSYASSDGNGRLTLSMTTGGTPTGVYPGDYVVYLVNANQAFVMSADKHSAYVLLAGTATLKTQTTFSNASMGAAIVGYENAQSNPGLLGATLNNTLSLNTSTIFRTVGNGAGQCNTTVVDVAGLTGLVNAATGLGYSNALLNYLVGTTSTTGTSVCTVASNGRGLLNYPNPSPTGLIQLLLTTLGLSSGPPPARAFYLIGPDNGYFLETGYAGLGRFEPQTGTPVTLGSFDGSYVYSSLPAASLASINSSGDITANGAGSATSTLDLNVGVGNVNLLQLGTTSTQNYTVSNPATNGRFTLGATTVLYEIEPGRFVLVDKNILTTSPTISLLY